MTLLELMVEHGVQWPKGAEFAAQDSCGGLDFYASLPVPHKGGAVWDMYNEAGYITSAFLKVVASDRLTSVITRERYEQVVKKQYTEDEAKEYMDTAKADILSEQKSPLQHEISKTINTLSEVDISDEAAEVIIEHLRELLTMRREELKTDKCSGELTAKIDVDDAVKALRDKIDSEPQLTITDWRELREGDLIDVNGIDYVVTDVEDDDYEGCHCIEVEQVIARGRGACFARWVNIKLDKWRFINRPE